MEKKLYNLMDWREMEGILYADTDHPEKVLGQRIVKEGRLIQAFVPDSIEVHVHLLESDKYVQMEMADEAGIYAVLLPKKCEEPYRIVAEYAKGITHEYYDSYAFGMTIPEEELKKFNAGVNYEVYKYLGAHVMEQDGVSGVRFAVWAPEARRVSVVGDFNFWDGRRNMMIRRGDTGVFELFVPELTEGTIYKYEIETREGTSILKADPYATYSELRPHTASIVYDVSKFDWTDEEWRLSRTGKEKDQPVSIYEVHLGSWKRKSETSAKDDTDFYNYRDLAPMLADYVEEMGYTHVELMPVMEHPFDGSWGYQTTGYYAPTSRFGDPSDFMFFMNYMHKRGIGVILDWVPAHFPKDAFGLARFDGTCLYEHADPRQGEHPHWGTLIYNYARPEVSNFLIANALYWSEVFHADGIRMDAVASMLYLDYGKNDGEWVPNMYGGHENLDAVEFMKHMNSAFKKRGSQTMLIAEESTAWPKVTGPVEDDGLGFDYKWNMGWMNDFISYMQTDPYFRHINYGNLTFSMIYNYSEDFILVFSHDEVVHGKGSMFQKMAGDTDEKKYANLRLAYGYQMVHPGKKLLFMGQEFAQYNEWWEERELDWYLLENQPNKQMQDYVKALNHFYKSHPALYELDFDSEGFEWINNISADESIVVFARKASKEEDMLVVICNFDTIERENYKIGVPKRGKYKEIFNSDAVEFGGTGYVNPRLKQSKKDECDNREDSIRIKVPALGMSIFKYTPISEEDKRKKAPKKRATARKSAVAKKLEKEINETRKGKSL